MGRVIIITVLAGIVLSGLEGVAESAGPGPVDAHEHVHELHGGLHVAEHEHDDHDDHFCHCGVHTAALIASDMTALAPPLPLAASRHDDRFTSRQSPPLLRPPNR